MDFNRYDDAQVLLEHYSYEPAGHPELRIVITDDHPFDINQYLLPFAIVVGICFVIMLVIVVYKCIQVIMNPAQQALCFSYIAINLSEYI